VKIIEKYLYKSKLFLSPFFPDAKFYMLARQRDFTNLLAHYICFGTWIVLTELFFTNSKSLHLIIEMRRIY